MPRDIALLRDIVLAMSTHLTNATRSCPQRWLLIGIALLLAAAPVHSRRGAPWSPSNQYARTLSLIGAVDTPTLNVHTQAFLDWDTIEEPHPWSIRTWRPASYAVGAAEVDLYQPELFSSFNTTYPWGGNDGPLWQGVGGNGGLFLGSSLRWHGLELTAAPVVWWSQNAYYETLPAASGLDESAYFVGGIDYPQRYGEDALFRLSAGESELRYNWWQLTVGLSNQSIWLGPTGRNAIILSNNAGGFPRLDLGLRKTETPLGSVEALLWWGRLSESDYFDTHSDNDYRLFQGAALSYAPSFVPGLTLGINRVILSRWDAIEGDDLLVMFNPNPTRSEFGRDARDQRFSATASWKFPHVGFEVYGEWARNDHSGLEYLVLTPEHTDGFSLGIRQAWRTEDAALWLLNLELFELMQSRDYEINSLGVSRAGFYHHGEIRQGHTHQGQLLGAKSGTGSDSQYLSLRRYDTWGMAGLFLERTSYNKDVIYGAPDAGPGDIDRLNVELATGLEGMLFAGPLRLDATLAYMYRFNWNYEAGNDVSNLYGALSISYALD